ncbi:MAG: hypothetical protein AAGA90_08350 [Actinomycetota bacterium]
MSMRAHLTSLLAILAIAASACSSNNVTDLEVGDCFDDPDEGTTLISNVDMVDCAEPHDNEVYHVYAISSLRTDDQYFEDCLAEFEGYVGSDYATSEIFLSYITPTADGLSQGADEVICIAFLEPPNKLTGSVRGSGR